MKQIKIRKNADKQMGIRIPQNVYDKLIVLTKKHQVSIQEVIRYILENEIDNFN